MRRTISIAALLGCSIAYGQGAWNLGVRGSWGWLSPHHVSMWFLVEKHALMGELFYERPFSGKLDWHRDHGDPSWGIGLLMTDAGSPHHLGSVSRLLPYLDLPLVQGGRTELHCRLGWGLGWVQYPFELREHYQQTAIGSHANIAAVAGIEAQRTFGRITLGFGLSVDHQSNGSLRMPNLGVNLITANLSVRRWSGTRARAVPPDSITVFTPGWRVEMLLAWGVHEVVKVASGRHHVVAVSATAYRRVTRKSSFGAGLDLFNKASLAARHPELAGRSQLSLTQVGLHAGYALHFGGMAFLIDQGVYLLTPADEKSMFYHRIGMRQRIGRRLFANLTLKTHFGTADHLELGLGYSLP